MLAEGGAGLVGVGVSWSRSRASFEGMALCAVDVECGAVAASRPPTTTNKLSASLVIHVLMGTCFLSGIRDMGCVSFQGYGERRRFGSGHGSSRPGTTGV